ncbi:hypothetical protein LINPERHAP2_LOCUS35795 [Linum perenne]
MGRVATLVNVLGKLSEEINSQVATFHVNQLQRCFLAFFFHSVK